MRMNKTKLKNNQNQADDIESEDNVLDLALLRRPISTSITGLEEVLRAYNDGTSELKKLLSKECDLIYECKVCRNIFRSLTNFISHKRVYCRSSFNTIDHFHFRNNGFAVQDISEIIQAEQKISNNPSGIAGVLPGSEDKSKDLSSVVEHILWKQHQSRLSNVNDVYDQINSTGRGASQKHEHTKSPKNHTLMLNPVNDSDIAVYQSVQAENDNSNMKNEINEVHNMLKKTNTVLGPDGKILNLFNSNNFQDDGLANIDSSLICQVCNLQFETEKTLKLHLEMKHLPSTYVYQCPSCPQKFSSTAAVIKHLSNDHKKSNRRIRLMRDNIIKKRIRADEVSTKTSNTTSRELQQLQMSNGADTSKISNSEWNGHDLKLDNGVSDDSYICPSCLKKFDRKAVYTSHVQMCSDIKDREQERLKKRKAKDGAKLKQLMGSSLESEDNSNISEQHVDANVGSRSNETDAGNKCKHDTANKVKTNEYKVEMPEEDSEDIVDWNLDDEEEKKKLDNIKKEIIEDEYMRNSESNVPNNSIKLETNNESSSQEHDDEDDSGLIIDEKVDDESSKFKCPTCNKVFATDEKLKYHLTFYHSRQKRFKCKMCEYQGYRKKDTMNHINFVHNSNVTLETLGNYTETVSKAVNEEDVKIQNELKKNQLKIKRKMARERLRRKAAEEKMDITINETEIKIENGSFEQKQDVSTSGSDSPTKVTKSSRKSMHASIELASIKFENGENKIKVKESHEIKQELEVFDDISIQKGDSSIARTSISSSIPNISRYGKAVKNVPSMDTLDPKDPSNSRPIRNRIKPVRKDFLYDLSDLLKKEADCYREQTFQSSNVVVKRELRKRAMSTHTRETPNINSFDQSPKKQITDSAIQPLGPPPIPNTSEESPLKLKDQKNRRMSVFPAFSTRTMLPPQPRSPPYKPPATHKNAGSALKMALKEFDSNRVSLYEPKFLWTICFEHDSSEKPLPTILQSSSNNISAAASILQRLSGKGSTEVKNFVTNDSTTNSLIAEQLCKKFELINVTNINEFDIPESNAININPGATGNNLISLTLDENDTDVCVLQECSGDSDDEDDSEPKLEIECKSSPSKRSKRNSTKRQSEKRKSTANVQRRLTVMQRLQENKIRKSREQLFQRLINQQNDSEDNPSSEFDLFTES